MRGRRHCEPPQYPLVFGGAKALVPAMISRGESFDCATVLPHPAPHPALSRGEREPRAEADTPRPALMPCRPPFATLEKDARRTE